MESLVCNLYLSVAARKIVCADPYLRYTCMLLGRYATNQPTNKQLNLPLQKSVDLCCLEESVAQLVRHSTVLFLSVMTNYFFLSNRTKDNSTPAPTSSLTTGKITQDEGQHDRGDKPQLPGLADVSTALRDEQTHGVCVSEPHSPVQSRRSRRTT